MAILVSIDMASAHLSVAIASRLSSCCPRSTQGPLNSMNPRGSGIPGSLKTPPSWSAGASIGGFWSSISLARRTHPMYSRAALMGRTRCSGSTGDASTSA